MSTGSYFNLIRLYSPVCDTSSTAETAMAEECNQALMLCERNDSKPVSTKS
jgi:hypothetical protein